MPGDPPTFGAPAPPVEPAIFVASLVDYVNGILHGRWFDACLPAEALDAAIADILAASPWTARTGEPAEEWVILDREGADPWESQGHSTD